MISTIPTETDRTVPYGLLIAVTIFAVWAISLALLISAPLEQWPKGLIVLAIAWQTFVYTGLFITAHDAMHGSIFPANPKINHFVGAFAVTVYALFPYKKLLHKHWQHHRNPASGEDPDFHNGRHKNIVAWYFHFMLGYMSWQQVVSLISLFYLIHWGFHIPENNLYFFWILPSFLSSLQLFYFGTFLPHHEPVEGYTNPHRAETHPLPVFWSFVTCYHFGYHQEHHEQPQVPWWQLPAVYKNKQSTSVRFR